jgi:hypothetical protein
MKELYRNFAGGKPAAAWGMHMKPGRNDPCSCGSGAKYKQCCGRVIALAPARGCGSCTACCDGWMAGTIRGHDMSPGTPCHFRGAGGCTIYDERPDSPCRSFVCAWLAPDSPFPDELRPDRCGVIIANVRWRDQPAYLLRSAGQDPAPALLAAMQRFSMQTGRPFFYEMNGEKLGFGPPLFQQDMLQRAQRGEPMW